MQDPLVAEVFETYRGWVAGERHQLPAAGGLEDQTLIYDGLQLLDQEWLQMQELRDAAGEPAQTSA